MPVIASQQGCNSAISEATKSCRERDDRSRQDILVMPVCARFSLGGAMLTDHAAGPTLGNAKLFYHMIDRDTLT